MHKLYIQNPQHVCLVCNPVWGPRPSTGLPSPTQTHYWVEGFDPKPNPDWVGSGLGLGFTGSCGRLPVLRQHQAFGSVLQHQGLAAPDTQSGATMLQRECCSTVNSANTTNLVICISYIEKPVILGYFIYSKQEIWKRSLLYLFNYLRFICSSQYIYIYYHLSDTSVAYINASYYFV